MNLPSRVLVRCHCVWNASATMPFFLSSVPLGWKRYLSVKDALLYPFSSHTNATTVAVSYLITITIIIYTKILTHTSIEHLHRKYPWQHHRKRWKEPLPFPWTRSPRVRCWSARSREVKRQTRPPRAKATESTSLL